MSSASLEFSADDDTDDEYEKAADVASTAASATHQCHPTSSKDTDWDTLNQMASEGCQWCPQ